MKFWEGAEPYAGFLGMIPGIGSMLSQGVQGMANAHRRNKLMELFQQRQGNNQGQQLGNSLGGAYLQRMIM